MEIHCPCMQYIIWFPFPEKQMLRGEIAGSFLVWAWCFLFKLFTCVGKRMWRESEATLPCSGCPIGASKQTPVLPGELATVWASFLAFGIRYLRRVMLWKLFLNKKQTKTSQNSTRALRWWSSGKDSACQCGNKGLIPGPGNSTCHGATKPGNHDCWACSLEPRQAHAPRACALQQEKPPPRGAWAPEPETNPAHGS